MKTADSFLEALERDPAGIAVEIDHLLSGNHGQDAMHRAQDIIVNRALTANVPALILRELAANYGGDTPRRVLPVWRSLSREQMIALNVAISGVIHEHSSDDSPDFAKAVRKPPPGASAARRRTIRRLLISWLEDVADENLAEVLADRPQDELADLNADPDTPMRVRLAVLPLLRSRVL